MKKILLILLLSSHLQARDRNLDLAATTCAFPQVFTSDNSEEVIQMAALLDMAGLGLKSASIAQDGIDALTVKGKAKIAAYVAGSGYDLYAMTSPDELVTLTKNSPREMKRLKRIQQALVLLEAALRCGVLYAPKIGQDHLADLGVEAADLIGISRLMARHWPVTPQSDTNDFKKPTTTLEAPKLSLLRDESLDASLGIEHSDMARLLHVPEDLPPFVEELPTDIEKPVKKKKKKKSIVKTIEVLELPVEAKKVVEDIMYPPTPFTQRPGGTLEERLLEVERYKKWEAYCREYEVWMSKKRG